jgi:hypothetical protein
MIVERKFKVDCRVRWVSNTTSGSVPFRMEVPCQCHAHAVDKYFNEHWKGFLESLLGAIHCEVTAIVNVEAVMEAK